METILIMEDVNTLLREHGHVLVYDVNTARELEDVGHRVTPRYEVRVDVDEFDRIVMKRELIGYMVEM